MKKAEQMEIEKIFNETIKVITESKPLMTQIVEIVDETVKVIKNDGKIIAMGNGGSAADAQHFVAEFIGRFYKERSSIPALALTTDSSVITSIGNDYSFEKIFARQCESMVNKNDIVFAISTSGKSKNIIEGIKIAKKKESFIVGITGSYGKSLETYSDIVLCVPSKSTPRIQEIHRIVLHIICQFVEDKLS
jgi:D-sedoheptulose 7-phosphate isomerase